VLRIPVECTKHQSHVLGTEGVSGEWIGQELFDLWSSFGKRPLNIDDFLVIISVVTLSQVNQDLTHLFVCRYHNFSLRLIPLNLVSYSSKRLGAFVQDIVSIPPVQIIHVPPDSIQALLESVY